MKNQNEVILFTLLLVATQVVSIQASASPFGNWGGSNWGGSGWTDDCNDWPEWTPMYWMEEMMDDCDSGYSARPPMTRGPYGSAYRPAPAYSAYATRPPYDAAPYLRPAIPSTYSAPQTVYQNPYNPQVPYRPQVVARQPYYASSQAPTYAQTSAYPRANPAYTYPGNQGDYIGYRSGVPQRSQRTYRARPYSSQQAYAPRRLSFAGNRFSRSNFPSWGRTGGFPSMNNFGTGFSPATNNFSLPFSGSNPMGNSFSMPMSGSMSPMGFGAPMNSMSNPMNPISPMGMGSGFGSPFSSGMSPFSGGMRSPFSF